MNGYAWILVMLIPCCCYAQPGRVAVAFCPLAAVDEFSFPTVQSGLELKLRGNYSLYNEIGVEYRRSGIDLPDSVYIRAWGVKVKTELRKYLKPGFYWGMNVFLTRDDHNTDLS